MLRPNLVVVSKVFLGLVLILGCSAKQEDGKPLEWHWSKVKASLAYSVKQHVRDYAIELASENDFDTPINIRTLSDRKLIFSLEKGHKYIVFTRWKDVLYIAEYSPIASGCTIVALDLKTGIQLWLTLLEGIGPTQHSKYRNLVNIETDGQKVIIMGNESHGRYIESLDIQSGKRLANKKFNADTKSLYD